MVKRHIQALQQQIYKWRFFHLIMTFKQRPSFKLHWRSKIVWFIALKIIFYYFLYQSIYSSVDGDKAIKASARPSETYSAKVGEEDREGNL